MIGLSDVVALLVVATLSLTLLAGGSVVALDDETVGDGLDEVDNFEIDTETECLSGAGTPFTVGSDDDTYIWIRLHVLELTDSGGSFGVELTGSNDGERVIEVVTGLEHVGDGILDTVTSPVGSYELVGGFEFELSIFDDATPDIDGDGTPGFDGPENESTDAGTEESDRDSESADGPFELLDC